MPDKRKSVPHELTGWQPVTNFRCLECGGLAMKHIMKQDEWGCETCCYITSSVNAFFESFTVNIEPSLKSHPVYGNPPTEEQVQELMDELVEGNQDD